MVLLIHFLSRKVFNVLAAIHRGITASFKAATHRKGAYTLLKLPRALSNAIRSSFNLLCNLWVILERLVAQVRLRKQVKKTELREVPGALASTKSKVTGWSGLHVCNQLLCHVEPFNGYSMLQSWVVRE